MTLTEVGEKFEIPIETLKQYVSFGFIKECKDDGYQEKDFECLGLIDMLWRAGFTIEEIKKYLTLPDCEETDEEQIRMLRKQRRMILNDIHEKQQLLDSIDFIVQSKKKQGG